MFSRLSRRLLHTNLLFISLRLRSRGEDPANYIVRKGITDVCIDGYPRSANSFSVRMFNQANPKLSIAHHTHSIANLKKAINLDIPLITLIRHPEGAIVSSLIAHKNNDIDAEVYRYIDFYGWVYRHKNEMLIADFEQVVNDFNGVISNVNSRYNKSFFLLPDVKLAEKKVKGDIEKRFDKLGQTKMSHIKPVPAKERIKKKERLLHSVISHPRFDDAIRLYKKILLEENG